MSSYSSHYSVMLTDCMKFLSENFETEQKLVLCDMTFGAGGHSLAMAERYPNARVFSVDQDPDALENGKKIILNKGLQGRMELLPMNFSKFPQWADENFKADAIIMDLGVSSHHFDSFERGFSFREDADLDMRMNNLDENIEKASDVLNSRSEEELADIIFHYGEERLSRKIAKMIVEQRQQGPILRTKQLENICFHAYPAKSRHKGAHPATRTFQALRIYVNSELDVLQSTLPKLYDLLREDGLLMVISFHSLEDRIVKRTFKEIFQTDKNAAKILTKRPLVPSENEIDENHRSRSAKLRVIKKINPGGVSFGDKKYKA